MSANQWRSVREDGMICSANISPDGKYRYRLTRTWDTNPDYDEPRALFVMLNPSTADHEQDDPTIRRCIGFARAWGCGGLTVVSLFGLRATDPQQLGKVIDPWGDNQIWLHAAIRGDYKLRVCAWGAHKAVGTAGYGVRRYAASVGTPLHHLGLTAGGHPRHPLYLPKAATPTPWSL